MDISDINIEMKWYVYNVINMLLKNVVVHKVLFSDMPTKPQRYIKLNYQHQLSTKIH